jgi:hypothetical protein
VGPNVREICRWTGECGVPAPIGVGFVNEVGRLPSSVDELLTWGASTGRYNPTDGTWVHRVADTAAPGAPSGGPVSLDRPTGVARGYTGADLARIFDRLVDLDAQYRLLRDASPSRDAWTRMLVAAGVRSEDAAELAAVLFAYARPGQPFSLTRNEFVSLSLNVMDPHPAMVIETRPPMPNAGLLVGGLGLLWLLSRR